MLLPRSCIRLGFHTFSSVLASKTLSLKCEAFHSLPQAFWYQVVTSLFATVFANYERKSTSTQIRSVTGSAFTPIFAQAHCHHRRWLFCNTWPLTIWPLKPPTSEAIALTNEMWARAESCDAMRTRPDNAMAIIKCLRKHRMNKQAPTIFCTFCRHTWMTKWELGALLNHTKRQHCDCDINRLKIKSLKRNSDKEQKDTFVTKNTCSKDIQMFRIDWHHPFRLS